MGEGGGRVIFDPYESEIQCPQDNNPYMHTWLEFSLISSAVTNDTENISRGHYLPYYICYLVLARMIAIICIRLLSFSQQFNKSAIQIHRFFYL
jgi:hypothetical protein